MSDVFFVGEGNTDIIIIEAIVKTIDPTIALKPLQPSPNNTDQAARLRGNGWQGVQKWCEQEGENWMITNQNNLLILNVDASIAKGAGVACGCPPASATTDALRTYILTRWLDCSQCPSQIIFCIPAQEIDLWVWTALYPNEVSELQNPECEPEPARSLLYKKEKLVKNDQRKKGELKKSGPKHREIQPRLIEAWPQVAQTIPEAGRFDAALRQALTRP